MPISQQYNTILNQSEVKPKPIMVGVFAMNPDCFVVLFALFCDWSE